MSETEQLIHDIRSPLSAIRGYAQMLQRRLATETTNTLEVEEGLRHIVESAKRVAELLDQLAVSPATESSALKREPADLVELARGVAAESQAAASGRGVVIVLASVPALVGSWDVGRLTRVLANLVGNALKYNHENRPVLVAVQQAGDHALLTVTDHGLGIPAADLPHVLEGAPILFVKRRQ